MMRSNPKDKSLKVCEVCAVEFTYRKFIAPLAESLAQQGYAVHAVFSPEPDVPCAETPASVIVHRAAIARSLSPLALLRAVLALRRLFVQERFSVVHVHTPVAAIAGRLAARLAGVPVVLYTAHGFYFHDQMPQPLRWAHIALECLLARLTTEIFTVSAEDAAIARRLRFLPAHRIHAIGNGVSATRFAPANLEQRHACRERFGLRHDGLVIGIVARLVAEKGYPQLLAAFEQIAAAEPRAQLLICGSRLASDHAAGIDDQLASLQQRMPQQLVLAGELEDVEQAYQAMDVFCLPSWREGLPYTILEAMMSGLPVVATAIRGCREAVVPDVTGLLVPPRQSPLLAEALLELLGDPQRRLQMGAAGRARALAQYEAQAVMARQLELVDQAITRACPC
jgi:glycosyltransferase involved in cell wall biosynthesis